MADLIPARPGLPTCRQLDGCTAITIHHGAGDNDARLALERDGLVWPALAGDLTGNDPYLAWCSPHELLALGSTAQVLCALLDLLAPGRSATALALDRSDALVVFELAGPQLDLWLAHLVDASAIPRRVGSASRCRLADIPVLMLRPDFERVWLAAERPVAAYLGDWLVYSHDGAFATGS